MFVNAQCLDSDCGPWYGNLVFYRTVSKRNFFEREDFAVSISYTRMLQFYQHFSRFYCRRFAPLLTRSGLSMRGDERTAVFRQ